MRLLNFLWSAVSILLRACSPTNHSPSEKHENLIGTVSQIRESLFLGEYNLSSSTLRFFDSLFKSHPSPPTDAAFRHKFCKRSMSCIWTGHTWSWEGIIKTFLHLSSHQRLPPSSSKNHFNNWISPWPNHRSLPQRPWLRAFRESSEMAIHRLWKRDREPPRWEACIQAWIQFHCPRGDSGGRQGILLWQVQLRYLPLATWIPALQKHLPKNDDMMFTNLKCLYKSFWEASLLQNENLSLGRYATLDEHIIMHCLGQIRRIPPHLTWHPLANLQAALSWASKNGNCPPFQACTNRPYWRFPRKINALKMKKEHLPNLVGGRFNTFLLNTQVASQRKCKCDCIVILA